MADNNFAAILVDSSGNACPRKAGKIDENIENLHKKLLEFCHSKQIRIVAAGADGERKRSS
jgi:hypothetical protein